MRNLNPHLRFLAVTLLFLAELMLAINLIQLLRTYAPREESALQSALVVARIQTAIPMQSQQQSPATTLISSTIPNQPTALLQWTATAPTLPTSTSTTPPRQKAAATASATPSRTPSMTPSATASLMPLSPTPIVVTNTPTPQNAATFEALKATTTAAALTTGTATPLPPFVTVTAQATATRHIQTAPTALPPLAAKPEATKVITTATKVSEPSPSSISQPFTTRILATLTTAETATPILSSTATAFYITPTPAAPDLFGAATLVAQLTIDATTTGTVTPLPPNWRVYTVRILPYEAPPANAATATLAALAATARAVTTGEAPAGVLLWTATPRPTNPPSPTPTATPSLPPTATPTDTATPFVVTATFTPENVLAAATLAAKATHQAATIGTATPLPANALLATPTPRPIVVTSTPTAANPATATAMAIEATAIAYTTGTPDTARFITATPTEERAAPGRPLATPTPLLLALSDLTATPTPNATALFPTELLGKILFLGDLDGRGAPEVYAIDGDGSNVLRLNSQEFYRRAVERDSFSADRRFRAFVKREEAGTRERQIYAYDAFYGSERQLTNMKSGSTSWDPVWSPSAEVIAFVTNQTDSDEIWLVERESRQVTQLTFNDGPWDKHPSWSSDGSQIVYTSSRTSQRALWIMASDGSNQRQLVDLDFEAWDPVWVKYGDQ